MRHLKTYRTRGFARYAAGLLAAASILVAAPPASGDLVLRLTSGATQVTVTDGGSDDSCGLVGCVTFVGPVSNSFLLNVVTGTSHPLLPATPFLASMSLTSVIIGNAVGVLVIELTDTDFPATDAGFFSVDSSGTTQGNVSLSAHKNVSNEEFDTTSSIAVDLGASGGTLAGSDSTLHGPLGTYSMTLRAVVTHGIGGTTVASLNASNASSASVPEPSTLVVLGLGLFGVGAMERRRTRN